MADSGGGGAGRGSRRSMAVSSSLDQQQQQESAGQEQKQLARRQQQQQPTSRRSSAVNFDQATRQVIGQYNQQQIHAGRGAQFSSAADISSGKQQPRGELQIQQPQQQIRRNSSSSPHQLESQQLYYYPSHQQQQPQGEPLEAANNNAPNSCQFDESLGQFPAQQHSGAPMNCSLVGYGQQAASRYASSSSSGQEAAPPMGGRQPPYVRDDVDIVFNRLMALEAFRKLHPTVIRNLCSYAFIERIDKGVIVFRQGDDAINWYALLEGSVDVKVSQSGGQKKSGSYEVNSSATGQINASHSDYNLYRSYNTQQHDCNNTTRGESNPSYGRIKPKAAKSASFRHLDTRPSKTSLNGDDENNNNNNNNHSHARCFKADFSAPEPATTNTNVDSRTRQQDGVTLCTLGVGTTFGASVMPGKSHSVSVVTSDDCTLLRVRRADFQEIFNEQSHLISDVESSPFCSFTSLNRQLNSAANSSLCGPRRTSAGRARLQQQQQPEAVETAVKGPTSGPLLANGFPAASSLTSTATTTASSSSSSPPPPLGERPYDRLAGGDQNGAADQEEELADLNLNSLDANELSSHLMRIGWVLRTLILDQSSQMIQNRRIHPHRLHHNQHQHHHHQRSNSHHSHHSHQAVGGGQRQPQPQHKQLMSMASSSQLLASQSGPSSFSPGGAKSAASAAGRKVANYVAASFLRSASKQQSSPLGGSQQQLPAAGKNPSAPPAPSRHQAGGGGGHQLFLSSSFDADLAQAGAAHHSQPMPAAPSSASSAPPGPGQPEPVLFRRSMVGREMVDWLMSLSNQAGTQAAARFVSSRLQAVSMWQVLLEQGIVFAFAESADAAAAPAPANCCQFQFCDEPQAYYKFWFDREGTRQQAPGEPVAAAAPLQRPPPADLELALESVWWSLKVLAKLAPDACFRLILSRRPHERSAEEVDIVFEELQHLKALSHLTNSVKKQLAACVTSEHHAKQNTVIFNQGDAGHSWYIILRGSVNVVIVGKGVVCTLHEGDDFGKLALVNDAPRAATIVTNEPNCYFLRVDKHNFNTILRDVEANTVRLKEHGKEVLILQKVPVKEPEAAQQSAAQDQALQAAQSGEPQQQQPTSAAANSSGSSGPNALAPAALGQPSVVSSPAATSASALKYMVMAGTGEKMLEHLLETRIDGQTQISALLVGKSGIIQHDQVSRYIQCHGDNFLEDFILTHKIFMPTSVLCNELLKQYQCQTKSQLSAGKAPPPPAGSAPNYQAGAGEHASLDDEYLVAKKRRVVKFIRCWMLITREHFFHQQQIQSFLTTIHQKVKQDAAKFASLQPELTAVARILELHLEEDLESRHKGVQRWIDDIYGNILPIRRHSGAWMGPPTSDSAAAASPPASLDQFLASLHLRRFELKPSTIQSEDELVFRVYCADHSFATLKARVDERAGEIKQLAARKLRLTDKELILVHVKSNGERIIYNDLESNLSTSLSVNGRIFVCPLDHIDAISPLPEQDPFQDIYQGLCQQQQQQPQGSNSAQRALDQQQLQAASSSSTAAEAARQPVSGQQPSAAGGGEQQLAAPISSHLLTSTPTNLADIKAQMSLSVGKLEEFSSRDVAYCLTQLAWALLRNMHEFELIYTVFGRHNFKQITANLNVLLRHFNEIQYWVVTQICLSGSLSKRVQILRKFIKIAAHCKELQNLNAFFAIIMGLSNMAVARLTQTWERLPSKLKRTFSQFESLIDPSRNHRRYRIFISKMEPPIIPFMPLFLKDMTFAHEGNKTYLENGLINFEKMQMVAQTLRTIRYCKSRPMKLDPSACKFKGSIRSIELFFRDLKIIDNQRTLTQMSHQLEHRKT